MPPDPTPAPPNGLNRALQTKVPRRLARLRQGDHTLLSGFATFGLIGWAIALPTFLGAVIGLWIDRHFPSSHSWTLALLVAGLVLGCAQAGHWVSREQRRIQSENKKHE